MPAYDFYCPKCDKNFETIESIATYDGDGECPNCKNISNERIFTSRVHFIGTKVEDREFNHGLGIVTKGKRHREQEAKERGLIEVGSDSFAKNHEAMDKAREARAKKRWEED
jgi:hypothetical protein